MSKGINSKRKGKQGELELAAEVRRLFGVPARRTQQYCGQTAGTPDVESPGLPLHWEVKRRQRIGIYEAMQQAIDNADYENLPVVAWRKNNRPWLAIMRLDDLPQIAMACYLALASDECEL